MDSRIVIIGSMNMDLVIKSHKIPKVGETVLGEEIVEIAGGKGANQAVAMAKLGKNVRFLGKVGQDDFGKKLLQSMEAAGVDIKNIEKTSTPTGMAVINVDKEGNNNIIVILGANGEVDREYLYRNKDVIEESEIIVLQHEIPLNTVKEALSMGKSLGKTTILNPAPAEVLDDETMANIDILIPNEFELESLSKKKILDDRTLIEAGKSILEKGIEKLIITLGKRGVLYISKYDQEFFPAYNVKAAVDTTAAGDSFIGGFVSSYIDDKDIIKAIDIGQKTAALTIQKLGAQSSLPSMDQVGKLGDV